jgi:hypothetical protein
VGDCDSCRGTTDAAGIQDVNRSLLRQSDFLRFWLGESVSWIGSQVTILALPLVGMSTVRASTTEIGVLVAASTAAMIAVTPFIGPWLDTHAVRPIIIGTNAIRGVILVSVPVAFWCSAISMPLLYVIAAAVGALTGVFDIAVLAYVPRLVHARLLVDASSKVGASSAVAETAGPALGGLLIRLVTAPMAILADIISYAVSIVMLISIKTPERVAVVPSMTGGVIRKLSWGIRYCFNCPQLRLLLIASAWFNLCEQTIMTAFLVYAIRTLLISAAALGGLLAAAGCGAAIGSIAAAPAEQRLGLGRVLASGAGIAAVSLAVSPIPAGVAVPFVLGPAFFMFGFGQGLFNVHVVAYRQTITPVDSQARVNAGYRLFTFGAVPVGAITAGFLGGLIGTRAAIAAAAAALVIGTAFFAARAWQRSVFIEFNAPNLNMHSDLAR